MTEFNNFYAPESTRPPVTLLPTFAAPTIQPQQQQAAGEDIDPESSLPPPAMFRLPFPGSERMKTDVEQFPATPMEQGDTAATATPQVWLSECQRKSCNLRTEFTNVAI